MDIPAHIIDAVHNEPPTPPGQVSRQHIHMEQTKQTRQLSPNRAYPQYKDYKDFHDSAEDVSTASISEPDHGYQTEPTTPALSEACAEDMSTDEVEDFKDREYPQLKGKTYMDHGGTTVSEAMQGVKSGVDPE
jgi:molybdenum cofactor sulfurtransferase